MKDREIVALLHELDRPTFFTFDADFCRKRLCHAGYRLVWLDLEEDDAAEFIRRTLHHPALNTRAKRMGVMDETRIYRTEDLAPARSLAFVATGVTDGELLKGVRFFGGAVRTHSIVMQLSPGKIRFIDSIHIEDQQHPPVIRIER